MSREIIPTAEPFYFPGNSTGCLLVHGITGSPKEMRWMGEYLNQQGFSVLGVRLFAHATRQQDMLRARWQDWLASVEDGWNLLKGSTQNIVLMGLSMGGILSLVAAPRYPVSGVVAMSTPYNLFKNPLLNYISFLKYLIPSVGKGQPDWHDLEAAKDHIEYPRYPTHGIFELRSLMAEMRSSLPQVTVPVLLINSKEDATVTPDHMEAIYNHLGSHDKECLLVENSGHAITRDSARLQVFEAAARFARRITEATPIPPL